ncbi:MAG: nuclease [Rhodobacteraceae bacterium]|nr:MAG: nuclease [Paracoccaceae bacterium]|tara:strand:- start:506 stop:979 length:474 start_codon:yes stop_codon:yes gene_type:complete
MEKIAIFVDVQNIYYTTRSHYHRKFNYTKFWNQVTKNKSITVAIAYATYKGDNKQNKFQNILKDIGFEVKLKPFITRNDGSAKGDWDVGITIDILKYAKSVDKVILASGDGDFELVLKEIKMEFDTKSEVFGVKGLTAASLIQQCTKFTEIDETLLL